MAALNAYLKLAIFVPIILQFVLLYVETDLFLAMRNVMIKTIEITMDALSFVK